MNLFSFVYFIVFNVSLSRMGFWTLLWFCYFIVILLWCRKCRCTRKLTSNISLFLFTYFSYMQCRLKEREVGGLRSWSIRLTFKKNIWRQWTPNCIIKYSSIINDIYLHYLLTFRCKIKMGSVFLHNSFLITTLNIFINSYIE